MDSYFDFDGDLFTVFVAHAIREATTVKGRSAAYHSLVAFKIHQVKDVVFAQSQNLISISYYDSYLDHVRELVSSKGSKSRIVIHTSSFKRSDPLLHHSRVSILEFLESSGLGKGTFDVHDNVST